MQKPSNRKNLDALQLFYISGVGTSPTFMKPLQEELERIIRQETGCTADGELLFPYGNWDRRLVHQIREVWHDVRLPIQRWVRSVGGAGIAGYLANQMGNGPTVLIGHSGGGVAALHAAYLLRQVNPDWISVVIQIGSPRCPIPRELQESTAYLYFTRWRGSWKDPVCRIGSWLAWGANGRNGSGFSNWRISRHRPEYRFPLQLRGGHPDYFRTHLLDASDQSNLSITTSAVWDFIRARL